MADIGDRLYAAARSLGQLQLGQELKPAYGRHAVQIKTVERDLLRHAASARAATERDERLDKAVQNIAKQIERDLENAKTDAEDFKEAEDGSDATKVLSPSNELDQARPEFSSTCRALDRINSNYRSRLNLDQGAEKVAPWSVYTANDLEDLLAEICKRIQAMEEKSPALGNDSERQAEEDLSQIGASDITVLKTLRDLTEGIDLALWNEATKKLKATGRREFKDIETKDHAKGHFGNKYKANRAGYGPGSDYSRMTIGGNSVIHAGDDYRD